MFNHRRIMYKDYWQIPFGLGEVQYGRLTGRIVIWGRRKLIYPRPGRPTPFSVVYSRHWRGEG